MTAKRKTVVTGVLILGAFGLLAAFGGRKRLTVTGVTTPPEEPPPEPGEHRLPGTPQCQPGWDYNARSGTCVKKIVITGTTDEGPDPARIVNDNVGPGDRTGTLYPIARGDNPTALAKRALGVGSGHAAIPYYVAAMAKSLWNHAIYNTLWRSDEGSTPGPGQAGHAGHSPRVAVTRRYTAKQYNDRGQVMRWYVGDAFYPHHKNMLALLRGGQEPETTTDEVGRIGSDGQSYGTIWLPEVIEITDSAPYLVIPEPSYEPPPELQALAPNIYA